MIENKKTKSMSESAVQPFSSVRDGLCMTAAVVDILALPVVDTLDAVEKVFANNESSFGQRAKEIALIEASTLLPSSLASGVVYGISGSAVAAAAVGIVTFYSGAIWVCARHNAKNSGLETPFRLAEPVYKVLYPAKDYTQG